MVTVKRGALAAAVGCVALVAVLAVSCRPGFERDLSIVDALQYRTPPMVRVGLVVKGVEGQASVACSGPYVLADGATGRVVASGTFLPPSGVSPRGMGIRVGVADFPSTKLRLRATGGEPLRLNGSAYAGDLLIFRDGPAVTLVDELDVETYLEGVLAAEMPLYFDDAALKAQVVAARTYVLFEAKTAHSPYYDVVNTQQSQVYQGLSAAKPKARKMVARTRGVILALDGKTFPAYFHSTCGGHTTNVSDVWPSVSLKPLRGVNCGYDEHSRYHTWEATVSAGEVARRLAARDLFRGAVENVKVSKRARSGYATRVVVEGPRGRREMSAYQFRLALDSQGVRSACFEVKRSSAGFVFTGHGWGHGVGLCQFGADGMGRKGYSYTQILAHYYPGATLMRIYP
jgi:stage II sporulation protein D